MPLSSGANLGLLTDGVEGEEHYADLMKQWRGLDGLVQPHVQDKDLTVPPTDIVDGQMYIVPAGATGAWTGRTNRIARGFTVGTGAPGWEFYIPRKGWSVLVDDEGDINGVPLEYRFTGTAWVKPDLGPTREEVLINPMTHRGDLIIGDVDGEAIRLPAGADTQVLTSVDGQLEWRDPPVGGGGSGGSGGMTNPMLAAEDLIVGGELGAPKRLPKGTNGQFLQIIGGVLSWAAGGGGLTNPMTTAGDIIVAGVDGVPTRLGKGADGQVLKMVAGILAWAADSGGGGGGGPTDTDSLPEGGTNLYFSASRVLAVVLTGLVFTSSANVAATDTVLVAIGKLQAQLNGKEPSITAGSAGQYWAGTKEWANLAAAVRTAVLTGLSVTDSSAVAATDSLLAGIGKLQAQSSALSTAIGSALTVAGGKLTGVLDQPNPVTIASATSVDIGSAGATTIFITGSTWIGSLGNTIRGAKRTLIFTETASLAYSTAIDIPGAQNFTAQPGDVVEVTGTVLGTWRVTAIYRYAPQLLNKRLTSAVTSNVATLGDMPDMTLPVAANSTYLFDCWVPFSTAASTTGINIGWVAPSDADCLGEIVVPIVTSAATSALRNAFQTVTANVISTGTTTGGVHVAKLQGTLTTFGAGDFKLAFASEIAGSLVTARVGAIMSLTKIA